MPEIVEDIKEPKVVRVDSWRDIPEVDPTDIGDRMLRAEYFKKENVIYVTKRATEYDIEHEKYHAKKFNEDVRRQQLQFPTKTRKQIAEEQWQLDLKKPKYGLEGDVAEEFEAHKYAYEKTGKPKRLDRQLAALYAWLTDRAKPQDKDAIYVENKPSQVMRWLHKHLLAVKPPKGWVEDYEELEEWYYKQYEEGKDNPKSIYYKDAKYDSSATSSNVVRKRTKNMKNWWEGDYYKESPKIKTHKKVFVGDRLLPPQLGGKI